MAGRTGLGYSPSGGSAPSINRLPSFPRGGSTAEGAPIGPTGKLPPVGGGTTLTAKPLSRGGTQAPPFDPGNQPGRPSFPPQLGPDLLKALGGNHGGIDPSGRAPGGSPGGPQFGNDLGKVPTGGFPSGWGNDGVGEQAANQAGKKMFGQRPGGIGVGGGATAEGNPIGSPPPPDLLRAISGSNPGGTTVVDPSDPLKSLSGGKPGGWGVNWNAENDANEAGKNILGQSAPPDPASSMTNLRAIASSMGLHGGPMGGMIPQNQTNAGAGPLDTGSPGSAPSNPMISSLAGSSPATLQAITSVLNGGGPSAPGGPQAAIMGVNPMVHANPVAPPPGANVPNKNLGFAASGGGGMAPENRLAY